MSEIIFKCEFCNYQSKRKYNLIRHHNALHTTSEPNKKEDNNVNLNRKNVNYKNIIVNPNENIVNQNESNVNSNEKKFNCCKCYKKYKTKKSLIKHEEKCNGLNVLTCPKCMFTFSSRISKSAHIKRNNCKARSIIHAVNPDIKPSISINGNNNYNTTNNITNNNIINNFGNERTDYITFDDMIKILRLSGNNIIPKYIEFKHFNKDFPENHNIKYEKNNDCMIKKNGEWKITNIDNLSTKLIDKNSSEINNYYSDQRNRIEEYIQNIELMEFINKRFNYLDLSLDKKLYKNIKDEIKEIIRSTKI